MAEGYIDLSPIIGAINTVNSNLSKVNDNVINVSHNVVAIDNRLTAVYEELSNRIVEVQKHLQKMEDDQRKAAALQRAITEVIRVRQELEQKFGTHQQVREYMLGILQATDLGLITKSTISKCTEQLMISAPKYWLAPALIALAAWISDDRALAERAVKEAIKRDAEKTYLLFALITRRVNAGRIANGEEGTDTCFLWLDHYFAMQNPFDMRTSIVAYVDAYANGVFGKDRDHICQDHINQWMKELMDGNPNFAEEQKSFWKNYFDSHSDGLRDADYQSLKAVCREYREIERYVSRIDASERTDKNGSAGIKQDIINIENQPSDMAALVAAIDDQLMRLVTNYEDGEECQLREEEKFLARVKELRGDEDRATRELEEARKRNVDLPVDFAKRLSLSVIDNNASTSEKKTALNLLRPYIVEAFGEFITEYKDSYPENIHLAIEEPAKVVAGKSFTWSGETKNGENKEELVASLEKQYETERTSTLNRITDDAALAMKKSSNIAFCFSLFIIPIFIGISRRKKYKAMIASNEADRRAVNSYFDKTKAQSAHLLESALAGRNKANKVVADFQAKEGGEELSF
ncbi:MAG: hypothetical protein SOV72_01120 [Candidatus Enteromonas sp.]|nr:hypothetical protein [Candidatus Enteromonas sp.]